MNLAPSKGHRKDALTTRFLLRLGLLGSLPLAGAILGLGLSRVLFCAAASILWIALEASIFFRVKVTATCRKFPFSIRLVLALCLDFQVCWLLAPDSKASSSSEAGAAAISTLSVVLPCANESEFVKKTIRAIYDATPREQLHEIIVVDDASSPVISEDIDAAELEAHSARVIRHDIAQGLIRTKKHGADSATGDVIVFLDCHVKPIAGWTEDIFSNVRENPKRIVVPTITSLDPDSWEEVGGPSGGRKMCLTWNADFYWCNGYPGPYVPIMSGGLLALSRYWWETTGGYDSEMQAWGGENLDQSLRTWLCGGEIVVAETSRVAHMWRDANNPKTQLHYSIPTEHVLRNRLRAATSWMGPWANKVRSFPEYDAFKEGGAWHLGSLENVEKYKRNLDCRGFKWYLDRFQDLYSSIGALPKTVFNLRDSRSQLCLHHELTYQSNDGGKMNLRPCSRHSEAQRFHAGNAGQDGQCCSGIKLWDIDICVAAGSVGDSAHAEGCFGFGESSTQWVKFDAASGMLQWQNGAGCITPKAEAAQAGRNKARFQEGSGCASRVEHPDAIRNPDMWQKQFRIVTSGNHCLTCPEGAENGTPLLFLPCAADNTLQVFTLGHAYSESSHQIKTSTDWCVDAANGAGPIAYQCHPIEDNNPQQQYNVKFGATIVWSRETENDEPRYTACMDSMMDTVSFLPCASSSDGMSAKLGQNFARHDERDGSFQLKEVGTESCLRPVRAGGEMKLVSKPCEDNAEFRWTSSDGKLKNVGLGTCLDSNDSDSPILYDCVEYDNPRQQFKLQENGAIEIPHSWADNGRVRYLGKCLDSKPVDPVSNVVKDCKEATESGTSWEQIWQETPLETQLFLDASEKRGNLRKS